MSCIHYKFKSSREYDTLTFDGLSISLADLRKAITAHKKLGKTTDFELQITNAQTGEVYKNEDDHILKNTSVIVARIPIGKPWENLRESPGAALIPKGQSGPISIEQLRKTADLVSANASEEDKILAMMSQSTRDYDQSNYIKPKFPTGPPPVGYTCHKCQKTGHFIHNCPVKPDKDAPEGGRIKRPTGIPQSFMIPASRDMPGAMMTAHGQFAVPAIDAQAYLMGKKEKPPFVKSESPERQPLEEKYIPKELLCPICNDIITDAVVISCCGNSFCDDCIRNSLLETEDHICPSCGESGISPDSSLTPNIFLRKAITNFLNETGYAKVKKQAHAQPEIVSHQVSVQENSQPVASMATSNSHPQTSYRPMQQRSDYRHFAPRDFNREHRPFRPRYNDYRPRHQYNDRNLSQTPDTPVLDESRHPLSRSADAGQQYRQNSYNTPPPSSHDSQYANSPQQQENFSPASTHVVTSQGLAQGTPSMAPSQPGPASISYPSSQPPHMTSGPSQPPPNFYGGPSQPPVRMVMPGPLGPPGTGPPRGPPGMGPPPRGPPGTGPPLGPPGLGQTGSGPHGLAPPGAGPPPMTLSGPPPTMPPIGPPRLGMPLPTFRGPPPPPGIGPIPPMVRAPPGPSFLSVRSGRPLTESEFYEEKKRLLKLEEEKRKKAIDKLDDFTREFITVKKTTKEEEKSSPKRSHSRSRSKSRARSRSKSRKRSVSYSPKRSRSKSRRKSFSRSRSRSWTPKKRAVSRSRSRSYSPRPKARSRSRSYTPVKSRARAYSHSRSRSPQRRPPVRSLSRSRSPRTWSRSPSPLPRKARSPPPKRKRSPLPLPPRKPYGRNTSPNYRRTPSPPIHSRDHSPPSYRRGYHDYPSSRYHSSSEHRSSYSPAKYEEYIKYAEKHDPQWLEWYRQYYEDYMRHLKLGSHSPSQYSRYPKPPKFREDDYASRSDAHKKNKKTKTHSSEKEEDKGRMKEKVKAKKHKEKLKKEKRKKENGEDFEEEEDEKLDISRKEKMKRKGEKKEEREKGKDKDASQAEIGSPAAAAVAKDTVEEERGQSISVVTGYRSMYNVSREKTEPYTKVLQQEPEPQPKLHDSSENKENLSQNKKEKLSKNEACDSKPNDLEQKPPIIETKTEVKIEKTENKTELTNSKAGKTVDKFLASANVTVKIKESSEIEQDESKMQSSILKGHDIAIKSEEQIKKKETGGKSPIVDEKGAVSQKDEAIEREDAAGEHSLETDSETEVETEEEVIEEIEVTETETEDEEPVQHEVKRSPDLSEPTKKEKFISPLKVKKPRDSVEVKPAKKERKKSKEFERDQQNAKRKKRENKRAAEGSDSENEVQQKKKNKMKVHEDPLSDDEQPQKKKRLLSLAAQDTECRRKSVKERLGRVLTDEEMMSPPSKSQLLVKVPELSKWEREDYDSEASHNSGSRKRVLSRTVVRKSSQDALPRSVIESAEKVLSSKVPRPSVIASSSHKPGRRVYIDKELISNRQSGGSSKRRVDKADDTVQVTINSDERVHRRSHNRHSSLSSLERELPKSKRSTSIESNHQAKNRDRKRSASIDSDVERKSKQRAKPEKEKSKKVEQKNSPNDSGSESQGEEAKKAKQSKKQEGGKAKAESGSEEESKAKTKKPSLERKISVMGEEEFEPDYNENSSDSDASKSDESAASSHSNSPPTKKSRKRSLSPSPSSKDKKKHKKSKKKHKHKHKHKKHKKHKHKKDKGKD